MDVVGYIRVSSTDQNTVRQLDGQKLDKTFTDRMSGKDTNRPELTRMLEYIREGDTVMVDSMDRLARDLGDLRGLVAGMTGRGITVAFIKEGLTFRPGKSDHVAQLMLDIIGAIAQFERALIKERRLAGIAKAKERGVYKGRRPALTDEQAEQLRARAAAGVSKTQLAEDFHISRDTVYAYLPKPTSAPAETDSDPDTAERDPLATVLADLPEDTRPLPQVAVYDQLLTHTPAAASPAAETSQAPAAAARSAAKTARRRRTSWAQRMKSSGAESVRELVDISRPDESGVRRVTDRDGTFLGRVARETRIGGGRGRWVAWYDTGTKLPDRGWTSLEKAVVGLLLAHDDRNAMRAEQAKRDRRARLADKL
ncbi:DNA invertase Pin-like site-specific DNA recombinase [Nocardia sp. GAS34]|uniref:recombinase family protein n=1 Tax=unclassified Nocardia TaxID=2637762 RepID=UPI003D2264E6